MADNTPLLLETAYIFQPFFAQIWHRRAWTILCMQSSVKQAVLCQAKPLKFMKQSIWIRKKRLCFSVLPEMPHSKSHAVPKTRLGKLLNTVRSLPEVIGTNTRLFSGTMEFSIRASCSCHNQRGRRLLCQKVQLQYVNGWASIGCYFGKHGGQIYW